MASFQKYETKNGQMWMFKMRTGIHPDTGKDRFTTKRGFKRKKDAEEAVRILELELANGTYLVEKDILFKDFVKEWLKIYAQTVKISSLRIRTKESDRLNEHIGNIKISKITKKTYNDMILKLYEHGYAENTLIGFHTTGKMIFKKAFDLGLIKGNPTDQIKLPKKMKTVSDLETENKIVKYLEKEELAEFLSIAKEKGLINDYMFFILLAYSGMRSGELLALKWADIDFDESTVSITKTLYNPSRSMKNFHLLTPKTKGSIRKIKLDSDVMTLLKKHKIQQNELKMLMRKTYIDQDFIFTKQTGYPENAHTLSSRLKRILSMSSIQKHITPHSFRHTHTSLLIEAGVGIKEIQQRLGHTDIETTMNIYAHMTKDMEEKASHKFSELMKSFIK